MTAVRRPARLPAPALHNDTGDDESIDEEDER